MSLWFTSDPHFYHKNVIEYCGRPFSSVEEMNEKLIQYWNDTVSPDDVVYCLGDFSLAIRPVELYTPRLNGHKILIAGNHDWCHPSNKKSKTVEKANKVRNRYLEAGWQGIRNTDFLMLGDQRVMLNHFPYKGDTTDTRFDDFRLEDQGLPLLCGHVHEKWQSKQTPKGTLMINVGVDVWNYRPVHINELTDMIFT